MTAPTPKPDLPRRSRRPAVLGISAGLVFLVFAVALMRVLPPPHTRSDYMISGTLATLAALFTLFAGLMFGRRMR